MKAYGRDIKFLRTVSAECDIGDECPGGDIHNFNAALQDSNTRGQRHIMAVFISACNKGYELHEHFSNNEHEARWLSVDEVLALDDDTFIALFNEAFAVYTGQKPQMKTKPKGKKTAASKSSSTEPGTSTTDTN